ncbi:hypothetical protein C8R44DRAFT_942122 [Mycena epipterygia]|nr:hypothetical protein C8R44DRAFT_942122 [Mycena epipterygia]
MFEHTLKSLLSRLENKEISTDIAATILSVTGSLTNKDTTRWEIWSGDLSFYSIRLEVICHFCGSLPHLDGWISVVLAAGLLTHFYDPQSYEHNPATAGDPSWVHKALNSIQVPTEDHGQWDSRMVAGVSGLLRALHYYDLPPLKEHLPILLRVLSISGDISKNAAHLLVQDNIVNWFQDDELRPMLQSSSLWSSLVHGPMMDYISHSFYKNFIRLSRTLTDIPSWHSPIQKELCSWIHSFFKSGPWDLAEKYNSVLSMIWNLDSDYEFANNIEKALGLSFIDLSTTWEGFDFGTSDSVEKCVSWLRCTSSVVLHSNSYYDYNSEDPSKPVLDVTLHFKTIFSVPLHNSLIHAATAAKEIMEDSSEKIVDTRRTIFHNISRILEDMAAKMSMPTDTERDEDYWWNLHWQFEGDINALDKMIPDM